MNPTHAPCNFCGRHRIVVTVVDGKTVLENHFRRAGRKGGRCHKGSGAPVGARRGGVAA